MVPEKDNTILTAVLLLVSLVPVLVSAPQSPIWRTPVLDIMDETIGTLGLHLVAAIRALSPGSSPGLFEAEMARPRS